MIRKILKATGLLVLAVILVIVAMSFVNMKDRHKGYSADLKVTGNDGSFLSAGFSAVSITPQVPDMWTDVNNDSRYRQRDGDKYTDGNGNGRFDPVWMAGFSNSRAANGIHDELWARTVVIDDQRTRIALVALDAIGFMNDDVIDVRNAIPPETGITYTIIASLHDHEAPDLLGLWGKTHLKSGVNEDYREFVKKRITESIIEAAKNLKPAILEISQDLQGAAHLVKDTRDPQVFDSGLRIIKAIDKSGGKTLGSLVFWADHAETLWSRNLLITSDFPNYVREGIEKGIFKGDSLVKPGIGGIAVYFNGCLGGLMTTHPSLAVKDMFADTSYNEPSFEKAEAQGMQIANIVLNAMDSPSERLDSAAISLVVKSLTVPITNRLFRLGTALGILDRGTAGWMKMRTEVSAMRIGPLSFVTIPGEIYPEIVNGGVEAPPEGDFAIQPLELPPVREMMEGGYKFVIGLANDEIGYMIPKSQWDEKAPFGYGRNDSPYGEENSTGYNTASIIHENLKEVINGVNERQAHDATIH